MRGMLSAGLAFAIIAAPAADAGAQARGTAAARAPESVEGWLYLGRRSEGAWRPASPSIARAPYPPKPGERIVLAREALFYSAVDCRVTPLEAAGAEAAAQGPQRTWVVSAEGGPLEVFGAPIECPSVCGAKTVWARVRIPFARLVAVEP